jgi:hypothetical protein
MPREKLGILEGDYSAPGTPRPQTHAETLAEFKAQIEINRLKNRAKLDKWARNYLFWSILGAAGAAIFYVVMQQQYHEIARWPPIPAVIFIHLVTLGGTVSLIGLPSFAYVVIILFLTKLTRSLWPTSIAE